MDTHRSDHKSYKSGKQHFITSFVLFDKYGIDHCEIVLLENVNAMNKDELHAREAHYIKTLKCVNKHITLRTKKDYRTDNKDKTREYNKQYKEINRDKNKEENIDNQINLNNRKIQCPFVDNLPNSIEFFTTV